MSSRFLKKLKTGIFLACGGAVAFGGIGVWTGHEKFFDRILLPILNKADPELTHRVAVNIAKYHLTRADSETDAENLGTTLGSLKISNPIGIAAGFDKNGECMSGLKRMGFGWVEIGSVTPVPQEGNSKPRVFRLPEDSAVINRYGFNNDGHEVVHKRTVAFKRKYPQYPIGINLGANKTSANRIEDYCRGIHEFSDVADYFVINISSPNTPNLRDLQKSESISELLQSVLESRDKEARRIPIFIKVAPDLNDTEIEAIAAAVKGKRNSRVEGLIVSNTTISRVDLQSAESLRNEGGGLSGKPLSKTSTELIRKFYKRLKGEVQIIGVGGIWNGKDAYEKIRAGANVVQIYTALTYRGPALVSEIKDELSNLLKEHGFDSVDQAVGTEP